MALSVSGTDLGKVICFDMDLEKQRPTRIVVPLSCLSKHCLSWERGASTHSASHDLVPRVHYGEDA